VSDASGEAGGPEPEKRRVHCVVLGGGPAGSATALALLRTGRTVAILERTRYEGARIGETLPPESRRLFAALGILPLFEREGHLPSPGIISAWGSAEPEAKDFIFNPYGHGWHIDRARFDEMLVRSAEERGAHVHLGVSTSAARDESGRRFRVLARASGEAWAYECDHVVDATGRSPLSFGPTRRREVRDRLVALVGLGAASRAPDGRTILEAAELGWWYCANLPDKKVIATFMTDPGLVGRDYRSLWREELAKTRLVGSYLEGVDEAVVSVVKCLTYLRSPVVKDGWIAVGDAASAYDPLSSLGICKALESGMRAAAAIEADRLDDYEAWVRASFDDYLRTRDFYYASERRWPESPFWRARQAPG
jgi:flavin-dependent dehydrogenase